MRKKTVLGFFLLLTVEFLVGFILAYLAYEGFSYVKGFFATRIYPFSYGAKRIQWLLLIDQKVPIYLFLFLCFSLPILFHGLIGQRLAVFPLGGLPGKSLRSLGRGVYLIVGCCLLLGTLCASCLAWDSCSRIWKAPYAGIFHAKCGTCHRAVRPLGYVKSPSSWVQTLERMIRKDPGWISPEEGKKIHAYLVERRSYQGKDLYRAKCLICHLGDRLMGKHEAPVSWYGLLGRMHRENPFFLTIDDVTQLNAFISQKKGAEDEKRFVPFLESARQFEIKCGRCHFLKKALHAKLTVNQWREFLSSHRGKSPRLLGAETTSDRFIKFVQSLREREPTWFERHFPHDGY